MTLSQMLRERATYYTHLRSKDVGESVIGLLRDAANRIDQYEGPQNCGDFLYPTGERQVWLCGRCGVPRGEHKA